MFHFLKPPFIDRYITHGNWILFLGLRNFKKERSVEVREY